MLFFLYVWLRVEPALQHYALSPVFLLSGPFLQDHLSYPGGLLQYVAAFMLQLYRVSWLGALLTTSLAAALGFCTDFICVRAGCRRSWLPTVAPGALLLMAQAHYEYSWLAPGLAIAAALGGAAGYSFVLRLKWGLRLVVFSALSLPLYYVTCSGYLWFAVTCALLELSAIRSSGAEATARLPLNPCRHSVYCASSCLAVAAVLPYAAAASLFVITVRDAYALHLPLGDFSLSRISATALGAFLPVWLLVHLVSPFVLRFPQATGSLPGRVRRSRPRSQFSWRCLLARRGPAGNRFGVGWLMLSALAGLLSFSPQQKLLARIEFLAQHEQWLELAQLGPKLSSPDSAAISDINRALCHGGKLLDDMFRSPQWRHLRLWLNPLPTVPPKKMHKVSEILFELGHLNRAERMAGEALEIGGYQPLTLKRLFLINVLKGEPESGRAFLNVLAHTFWHRDWAALYRAQLADDPGLASDPALRQVRPFIVTHDYLGSLEAPALLQACLRQNPQNHMAADYLLAGYLLDRQLEPLATTLARMNYPNKANLPRHLQEALLLSQLLGKKHEIPGVKIEPVTVERFNAFRSAYAPYQQRPLAAQALLQPEFGDTYWYYYIYGHSGALLKACRTPPPK